MTQAGRPEKPIERAPTGELYRGSLIRELRGKKGLSREEMAKLLECNPDSLSKVETNGVNPSQQMLAKISEVLAVPLKHLEHAPEHPRILRKKTAFPRTAYRSPLATPPQKILLRRLAVLEKRLEAAERMVEEVGKNLQEVHEELRELGALAADMYSQE